MSDTRKPIILFVNVDGVLTSARTYFSANLHPDRFTHEIGDRLDPAALELLDTFCRELDADVVMASAWSSFIRTTDSWKALFESKGFAIPVVDMIERKNVRQEWIDVARTYMTAHPNSQYVVFDDDPVDRVQDRMIAVDGKVGLTTVDLHAAALLLAPEAKITGELADCNKAFSRNATVSLRIGNGPLIECHPRDLAEHLPI